MSFNFYIFGTPGGRYGQYPDDYIASTLSGFMKGMSGTRLVIHREMDLMHYAFMEKVGSNEIVGFCLIFNKSQVMRPRQLIRLFRSIVEERMIESGGIIRYTVGGNLTFVIKEFNECAKDYEYLKGILDSEFENNPSLYGIERLRSTYNGIKSAVELGNDVSDAQIVAMTNQHNRVVVNEDMGIENSYIPQLISSMREQNQRANERIKKLQEANAILDKKKKQYRYVVILILAVIACAVGIFLLNGSLRNTQFALSDAREEIGILKDSVAGMKENVSSLKKDIHALNETVDGLNTTMKVRDDTISSLRRNLNRTEVSLREVQDERDNVRHKFDNLSSKYGSVMPIIINEIQIANTYYNGSIETDYGRSIYSSNSMYLTPKIRYTGVRNGGKIELKMRLYTPSGMSTGTSSPSGYSNSTSIYVYSGENTATLTGWGGASKGHWRSGSYRIDLWYGNVCLRSKTFTIY